MHFTLHMSVVVDHSSGDVVDWEIHDFEMWPGWKWR
jgi:hypothetical protein